VNWSDVVKERPRNNETGLVRSGLNNVAVTCTVFSKSIEDDSLRQRVPLQGGALSKQDAAVA